MRMADGELRNELIEVIGARVESFIGSKGTYGKRTASLGSSRNMVGGVVSPGSGFGTDERFGSKGNASCPSETPSPSVSCRNGLVPLRISVKSVTPSPSVSGERKTLTVEIREFPPLSHAFADRKRVPGSPLLHVMEYGLFVNAPKSSFSAWW